MVNSKRKGADGERELSSKLKEHGYNTRRGQQYCGANGDADVVGLEGIHIECKRVEKLNLYDAMSQAKADAKDSELPTVFHRKDRYEWLVTMTLEDWIRLYKAWEGGEKEVYQNDSCDVSANSQVEKEEKTKTLKVLSMKVQGDNGTYTVCENGVELQNKNDLIHFENLEELEAYKQKEIERFERWTLEFKQVFAMAK